MSGPEGALIHAPSVWDGIEPDRFRRVIEDSTTGAESEGVGAVGEEAAVPGDERDNPACVGVMHWGDVSPPPDAL